VGAKQVKVWSGERSAHYKSLIFGFAAKKFNAVSAATALFSPEIPVAFTKSSGELHPRKETLRLKEFPYRWNAMK
jgi:hypothetical protein